MNILSTKFFNEEALIQQLRKVTMLKDPTNYIYKDVYISLENINTDYLIPPQNYLLNNELENKLELKYALEKHGYDLFNLNGYLEFQLDTGQIVTLLPPIVEESIEQNGAVLPIINDGMHRVYLARVHGVNPKVIFIRGVPNQYPYYAFPVIGGWDKVERVDSIPKGYIKKWHRIQNNKMLYRNFDSVFTNCSKPRGNN